MQASESVVSVMNPVQIATYWSDVPLRGPDFGKWSDVPQFRKLVGLGRVLNFGIRLKAHGIPGQFKGIHVNVRLDRPSCKDGLITISAGSDPWYDNVVHIGDLKTGDFDKSQLSLAVLSKLDFARIAPCDIHLGIVSPIGVGASLGTSAAMSVGILRAFLGAGYPADEIAKLALDAEANIAGRNTGCQDQIASAYGSALQSSACQSITIKSLFDLEVFSVQVVAVGSKIRDIFNHTLAIYIGGHDSSDIHHALIEELSTNEVVAREKITAIRECASLARKSVLDDDDPAYHRACHALMLAQKALSPMLVNDTALSLIKLAEECSDEDEPYVGACVPGAGGRGGTVLLHMGGNVAIARFAKRFEENEEYAECRLYDVRLADDPVV